MRVLWLSAFVVAVDQATKAAVLQYMSPQSGIPRSIPVLGDWLRLTFTENPGMAFGLTMGPPGTITVLSMIATCAVAVYIYWVRHGYAPYRWSLGLIFGGAVGNVIDRVFYGVLLDYGPYFTGRVVDFIHVSLWKGFIPDAIPVLGGAYMELFPIWNVADMAIVLGVVGVLVFHRAFHERRLGAHGQDEGEGAPAAEEESASADWPASSPTDEEPDTGASDPETEWASEEWPDNQRSS